MSWNAIIAVVAVLAGLAQILQWIETSRWLRRFSVSPKILGGIFNLCLLVLLGIGHWRVANLEAGRTVASEELNFAQWSVTPDGTSCVATIDTSRLSFERRDKYEIALACGFADPSLDKLKDDRITVSPLFTLENVITIVMPMSTLMAEALQRDREEAVRRSGAPKGMALSLTNTIWFRGVLLPKGADISSIHRLTDVAMRGGEVRGGPAIGIMRTVSVK